MNWLHTWLGLAISSILFAIFWMGSLSVFDQEIDKWMIPELRHTSGAVSLDTQVMPILEKADIKRGSEVWIYTPKERAPVGAIYYEATSGASHEHAFGLNSGDVFSPTDSLAGSGFIFPFHYSLHISWHGLGYWIVGFAAIAMLLLISSGLVLHRKIFSDFFTFRPHKKLRRSTLDLHNLASVIALPFHVVFPLTGLLIMASVYFSWPTSVPFQGDTQKMAAEFGGYEAMRIPLKGEPASALVSLDSLTESAERIWAQQYPDSGLIVETISIYNFSDANAYVIAESWAPKRRVAIGPYLIRFDALTGEKTGSFQPAPIKNASNWLEGVHWMQFEHWPLKWLLFFAGLSGCVMIGSGLQFWIQARTLRNNPNSIDTMVVRAIGVGSITGIIVATEIFLIANRMIPSHLSLEAIDRHELEVWSFFMAWALTFLHAVCRGRRAWEDQCWMISLLGLLAVLLNWLTTQDHLIKTLTKPLWPIAGMDLVILAGVAIASSAAFRLNLANMDGQIQFSDHRAS
ncbi:MAG: PepSY-associated TM helix domain-containing protein [Cyanobacteria bacterium P01_H01_bin.15]